LKKLKIDDPLDAFQVHGLCGLWGVFALAIFKIDEGIIYGHPNSMQLLRA
tara:strand:- start:159 stop:308 length:150 start_codon:yes stop_codon:yes gene_type:complete